MKNLLSKIFGFGEVGVSSLVGHNGNVSLGEYHPEKLRGEASYMAPVSSGAIKHYGSVGANIGSADTEEFDKAGDIDFPDYDLGEKVKGLGRRFLDGGRRVLDWTEKGIEKGIEGIGSVAVGGYEVVAEGAKRVCFPKSIKRRLISYASAGFVLGSIFACRSLDNATDTILHPLVGKNGSYYVRKPEGFLSFPREWNFFRESALRGELLSYSVDFGKMNPFQGELQKRQALIKSELVNLYTLGDSIEVRQRIASLESQFSELNSLMFPVGFEFYSGNNLVYAWNRNDANNFLNDETNLSHPNDGLIEFNPSFFVAPKLHYSGVLSREGEVIGNEVSNFTVYPYTLGFGEGRANLSLKVRFCNPFTGEFFAVKREDSINVKEDPFEYARWKASPSGKLTGKIIGSSRVREGLSERFGVENSNKDERESTPFNPNIL